MNTSLGTTVPSSGFNFFGESKISGLAGAYSDNTNTSNPFPKRNTNVAFQTAAKSVPKSSKVMSTNKPKHVDRSKIQEGNLKRSLAGRISESDNARIGSLLPDPQLFGFRNVPHKSREMPRFLVGQQPQLKSRKFIQDSWDKANQQKMLQLESSIDDITELYETLKKMRDVERKVMESKGLVDEADSAKDLTDAIIFQGTCEDMCPIFERARRNVEHTVYSYERIGPNEKKASREKALKVFARPAAAAAPPLPSDVRPPHILSNTLDYIVNNLLVTLPESEGFIWDRMRSIRQDFTYQNYSGPEAIDCNERIVRIHLLIIHIMAKSSVEFSLQQELEQLHKSLITLSEIYDEVAANGGYCPNEAEFRAYALLSKVRDPEYDKNIQELPPQIFKDEAIQIALCFRRIISNSSFITRGYIKTENCLNFYNQFFQLIRSGKVPFLMSSFLELYINEVRFYAFKALSHSINKRHKPIPTDYIMDEFLFNDRKEIEEFCDYYSIEMTVEGIELKTLTHPSHKLIEAQPLKQTYLKCVDHMLDHTTYTKVINAGKPNLDTISSREDNFFANTVNIKSKVEDAEDHDIKTNRNLNISSTPVYPQFSDQFSTHLTKSTNQKGKEVSFELNANPPPLLTSFRSPAASESLGSKPIIGFTSKTFPPVKNEDSDKTDKKELEFNLRERQKIQEEARRKSEEALIKERELFILQKKKNEADAAQQITNSIVKKVVHEQVSKAIKHIQQKDTKRKLEIEDCAAKLYYAFLHEKLYTIYLETQAEVHYNKKVKNKAWFTWKSLYKGLLTKREMDRKRKTEIQNVGRQLGVPLYKKPKTVLSTPVNDSISSFILPSSIRKDMTFSPVLDEVNKFSAQSDKRKEVWEPLDIKRIYTSRISEKCPDSEHRNAADIFVYGSNWSSISNKWLMNKFGLVDKSNMIQLQDNNLSMNISCIDSDYDPSLFTHLQLLVFNTGVTDSNIFDLEMKLQQDGEELIKLVTGISLNTNICFNLLILYWESTETPLSDAVIFKRLKLNRISKAFSSVLQDIIFINITGNAPYEELKKGLIQAADRYTYKLTERGKYHASLQQRRTLAGIRAQEQKQRDTTKAIDRKMSRILESEKSKYEKELDDRNTYAHLQSHISASPRAAKGKLPVLLSKTKENKFKTPLAIRSASSSSPAMSSHLALKTRRATRISSYHGPVPPATPSHSNNLPISSVHTNASPSSMAADASQISNTSFGYQSVVHEPALFQTPMNAATPQSVQKDNSQPPPPSPAVKQYIPNNLLELKNLIESVKRKVNHD